MKLTYKIKRDKEQFDKLKDSRSKILFLWDYYKELILLVLAAFSICVILAVSNIGRKDASMYVVLLNNDTIYRECDRQVFDRILEGSNLDLKNKQVDVNENLRVGLGEEDMADIETLQVLTALFTISDLDLYAAPKEWFDYFAKEGGYADLSLLIDKQVLQKHGKDLYYSKDEKGREILSGIILHEGSPLHEAGYYHDDVIIGVPVHAVNMDVAVSFLKLLLEG